MKNTILICTFFSLVLLSTGISKSPVETVPKGLMVEFIREPENVKIADPLPEYSWSVPGHAVRQTGFQILVSSSLDK
ncbi:MAG: hypothetical protein DWQ10_16980, partial [Calditrichaeota bacterium]